MDNEVILKGIAPFRLGTAQSAKAYGNTNNGVTVTLYAIIDGHGAKPIPIDVQMVSSVARELALELMDAAPDPTA